MSDLSKLWVPPAYPSTNNLPLPGATPAPSATGTAERVVSKDPLAPVKVAIPVNTSAGDSPIVRSSAVYFCDKNPMNRLEGKTPAAPGPNDIFPVHQRQS